MNVKKNCKISKDVRLILSLNISFFNEEKRPSTEKVSKILINVKSKKKFSITKQLQQLRISLLININILILLTFLISIS